MLCAEVGLVPSKEGYHAIKLEGCEFLLATTADGKLDLSDVYVQVSDLLCLHLVESTRVGQCPAFICSSSQINISAWLHGCSRSNYQKIFLLGL